jgi:hypothetical protein
MNASGNNMNTTNYVITPSAQPVVEGDADFFITADFIWWKPNQEGTSVAYPGYSDGTTAASKRNVLGPNFDFEPGFKLGIGTTMKHDTWDLYLNWTWFRSNDVKGHANAGTQTMWSDLAFSVDGDQMPTLWAASSARTRWDMHFNVIDLELGRNFWISKFLTLRPHFGLKTGWIHQNQSTTYSGVSDEGSGTAASTDSAQVSMK